MRHSCPLGLEPEIQCVCQRPSTGADGDEDAGSIAVHARQDRIESAFQDLIHASVERSHRNVCLDAANMLCMNQLLRLAQRLPLPEPPARCQNAKSGETMLIDVSRSGLAYVVTSAFYRDHRSTVAAMTETSNPYVLSFSGQILVPLPISLFY